VKLIMEKLRIAVLVSGRGSNLQAILDAIDEGALLVEVVGVFSNTSKPQAFRRAQKRGINTYFINPAEYPDRNAYDEELAGQVRLCQPDLVVLAGYMRIITPVFLQNFANRVVNIHPALLPSFSGVDAQGQAVAYGVRFSGCTVHFVDAGVDSGPVILQSVVPVLPDDTAEILAERILAKEHKTYPAALQLIAEGRVRVVGRRVSINWHDRIPGQLHDCVTEWQKIPSVEGGYSID
jgi:phosphoribosylglycinamide formyltransferase-1